MLKTSSTESAKPKKSIVGVDGGGRKKYGDRVKPIGRHEISGNEVDDKVDDEVGKNQKKSKSEKLSKSKKMVVSLDFFILEAGLIFTKLR